MDHKLASESTFRRIADFLITESKADQTVVSLNDSHSTTLRFANNQVVQHVAARSVGVSVEASFGQKSGRASANRLDTESLRSTLRRAEELARLSPEDPEYLPPLPKQNYLDVPSYRDSTASAEPADLARKTGPVIDSCRREGLTAAGILSTEVSSGGIAASSGLFGYEQSTESEFSLTAIATDSSGWTFNAHRDINALDVRARTRRAVDKAKLSAEPLELAPGYYPVILEPAAVAGVLGPLFFAASARSYYRGNSALGGKLGSAILDGRLTVRTDPRHHDLMGSRFGGEGLASRPMTWIENGVLKQLSYDRFTAKQHNVDPTPFPSGPIVTFAGPRASSTDDLIAKTERAILVTNFWYIRSVNPRDLTITGMTRDGTFLVENGKIVCGVRNFRFHESPLRCFAEVAMTTAPQESITMERGKMLLPAMKLPAFHFSSVTRF
jgi:predicted Zn-dependent protease